MTEKSASAELAFSAQKLAESETPSEVKLSPDASKLLYHVKPLHKAGEHETCAIWIADVGRAGSAKQFTSGLSNDRAARFHPDGERLIFLSDRHKAGGPAQLYSIGLSGGEAVPLFGKENKKGVSSFKISPDGRYIAFVSNDEPAPDDEQREKDKDDARIFGDRRELGRLRLFTFSTGSVRTLEQPLDKHVSSFYWVPDSKSILFTTRKQAELEFMLDQTDLLRVSLAPDFGSLQVIGTYPREYPVIEIAGGQIVDLQTYEPGHCSDSFSLFVHSAHDFSSSKRFYGETDEADDVLDLKHNGLVAVSVTKGLDTLIHVLDLSKDGRPEFSFSLFETKDEALSAWDAQCRPDGTFVLAVIKSSSVSREPPNVWAGTVSDKSLCAPKTKVSSHLKWMEEAALPTSAEPYFWKAKDGTELDGVVVYPPNKDNNSNRPFPTIMLIHGGPHSRNTLAFAPRFAQWDLLLASQGYLVIHPNYRGGTGHGSVFARAASGGMGTVDWEDCESMVDEFVRRGIADPTRLGIGGWSQGGFLTAWGVAATKNRFKAGVMGAGVADWGQLAAESDLPDFEADLGGAAPWDSESARQKLRGSPVWHVDGVETAVLILHGENDKRVPVSQGISYFRGLRRRSKYPERAQLVIYPREPHAFTERKHAEDVMKRVVEHFQRWL